jgi:hypothetical protein
MVRCGAIRPKAELKRVKDTETEVMRSFGIAAEQDRTEKMRVESRATINSPLRQPDGAVRFLAILPQTPRIALPLPTRHELIPSTALALATIG